MAELARGAGGWSFAAVSTRACQCLFAVLACAPLAWRLMGLGAMLAERWRRGSWPDTNDAVLRSNWLLVWMLGTPVGWFIPVGAYASPVLLVAWLWIERGRERGAGEVTREFRGLAAVWVVGVGGAVLLAWWRVTGVY
jgi:hypothetical protein